MYLLTVDGHSIIERPMTLAQIKTLFGDVARLEANGFRLIKVK